MQELEEYIRLNFKSKAEFARHNNVFPTQVSLWLSLGYVVNNNTIYRPLRVIPTK